VAICELKVILAIGASAAERLIRGSDHFAGCMGIGYGLPARGSVYYLGRARRPAFLG